MRGRSLAAPFLGCALVVTGCASGKMGEAIDRVDLRTVSIDSLQRIQRKDLLDLRKDYEDQSKFLRSKGADTDTRLAEMAHRLDAVVSRLEDNNERFSQVLQKFDASRLAAATTSAPAPAAPAPASEAPARAPEPGNSTVTDPKPLYDAAQSDYANGHYDQARTQFEQYVANFSNTELAGNAQYWLGETYFQQKRYPEAVNAYRKVMDQFPHNIKVPAALLKIGIAQVALLQKNDARATFKQLINDYPGTEQEAEARRQLKKLR